MLWLLAPSSPHLQLFSCLLLPPLARPASLMRTRVMTFKIHRIQDHLRSFTLITPASPFCHLKDHPQVLGVKMCLSGGGGVIQPTIGHGVWDVLSLDAR